MKKYSLSQKYDNCNVIFWECFEKMIFRAQMNVFNIHQGGGWRGHVFISYSLLWQAEWIWLIIFFVPVQVPLWNRPCSSWVLYTLRGCRWKNWLTRFVWLLISVRRTLMWLRMWRMVRSLWPPPTPLCPRKRKPTFTLDSSTKPSTPVRWTTHSPTTKTVWRRLQ